MFKYSKIDIFRDNRLKSNRIAGTVTINTINTKSQKLETNN